MIDTLLDEIVAREGAKDTNDPADSGGRTKYGISEKYHPEAWKDGPPTEEEAKDIFLKHYIIAPGIHKVTPDYLMNFVADIAVLSGPNTAIQQLQKALGVTVDGDLGPETLAALSSRNPEVTLVKLVKIRVLALVRLAQKRPKDLKWLFGWVTRSFSFLRD